MNVSEPHKQKILPAWVSDPQYISITKRFCCIQIWVDIFFKYIAGVIYLSIYSYQSSVSCFSLSSFGMRKMCMWATWRSEKFNRSLSECSEHFVYLRNFWNRFFLKCLVLLVGKYMHCYTKAAMIPLTNETVWCLE